MDKRVKAPLAAWIACACALVGLALVAYGIDAAQRLDADLLARFADHRGSDVGTVARGIVKLGDPLPLLLDAGARRAGSRCGDGGRSTPSPR